jgi:hypothetical protein
MIGHELHEVIIVGVVGFVHDIVVVVGVVVDVAIVAAVLLLLLR